jgi:hypothetical protein
MQCQTNNDNSRGCDKSVGQAGLYCKSCRERLMSYGLWTDEHAKRYGDFRAFVNERKRKYVASLTEEEKEVRHARQLASQRSYAARNRETLIAASKRTYKEIKLDPVRFERFRQSCRESQRKYRQRRKEKRSVLSPMPTTMMMMTMTMMIKIQNNILILTLE